MPPASLPTEPAPAPSPYRRRRLLIGLIFGLIVVCALATLLLAHPSFRPADAVTALREAGPWVFFGAMGLLPVIGFPLAPFNIAAGPAFAPTLGLIPVILLACTAICINVSLTYWLAKYTLRPLAARSATWLGYAIPTIPEDKHLTAAFLVRATPGPPFFLQSCLLGMAGVSFLPYMLASITITATYTTLVIVGGDALMSGNTRILLFCCAGLGAFALAMRLMRNSREKKAKK